jgi:flavin reductase (DIM6/NTAB) family NADH-FMN oxidoreductase RutF
VFRRHAAGVAIITAHGARPAGFTSTSLTSVAVNPPLISFNIAICSSSWPVIAEAEHVGVHFLNEEQQELAATFSRQGADRFAPPTSWHAGPGRVPLLSGVLGWLICRTVVRIPAGDHHIVVAEVIAGSDRGRGRPLLHYQAGFTALRS